MLPSLNADLGQGMSTNETTTVRWLATQSTEQAGPSGSAC